MSTTRLAMRTRRLPYMSPRRPEMGVTTAAARSVAVITHDASEAEASSSRGSRGMIGTTSVCMSDTTMPPSAITAVIAPGPRVRVERVDKGTP